MCVFLVLCGYGYVVLFGYVFGFGFFLCLYGGRGGFLCFVFFFGVVVGG